MPAVSLSHVGNEFQKAGDEISSTEPTFFELFVQGQDPRKLW